MKVKKSYVVYIVSLLIYIPQEVNQIEKVNTPKFCRVLCDSECRWKHNTEQNVENQGKNRHQKPVSFNY